MELVVGKEAIELVMNTFNLDIKEVKKIQYMDSNQEFSSMRLRFTKEYKALNGDYFVTVDKQGIKGLVKRKKKFKRR